MKKFNSNDVLYYISYCFTLFFIFLFSAFALLALAGKPFLWFLLLALASFSISFFFSEHQAKKKLTTKIEDFPID